MPLYWLPKVQQSLVWAFCPAPCLRIWVLVCVSEEGKAAVDCIVDLVLVSVLSPLSPKGSLSWFCAQSLSWFQWQWNISQGPLKALALSRLSPVFNFLFIIDISSHIHPGWIDLPWYSPCCNAHLEWLTAFPPSWSSETSVHRSALLGAAKVTSLEWAQGFLKSNQTFEETLHFGYLWVVPAWRAGGELHASNSWISMALLWKSRVMVFSAQTFAMWLLHTRLLSAYLPALDKSKCVGTDKPCAGILCGLRRDSSPCMCNQSQGLKSFSKASFLCGSSLCHLLFISFLLSADQHDTLTEA